MTYLIVRLATIGNVAMTVPVIASLSRHYPNDRFIVASKKNLGAMFASIPNVEFCEVDNHLDWKGNRYPTQTSAKHTVPNAGSWPCRG